MIQARARSGRSRGLWAPREKRTRSTSLETRMVPQRSMATWKRRITLTRSPPRQSSAQARLRERRQLSTSLLAFFTVLNGFFRPWIRRSVNDNAGSSPQLRRGSISLRSQATDLAPNVSPAPLVVTGPVVLIRSGKSP